MSRIDLYHDVYSQQLYTPIACSADANSSEIDMQGYESALIHIDVGAFTTGGNATNCFTFTVQDSDTTATLFTAVASTYLTGNTSAIVVDATSEDATLYSVGYVGSKRYVRVNINETGTAVVPICIIANKYRGRHLPAQS